MIPTIMHPNGEECVKCGQVVCITSGKYIYDEFVCFGCIDELIETEAEKEYKAPA